MNAANPLFLILMSVGTSGVAASAVTAVFQRRAVAASTTKQQAEAAKVQADAANVYSQLAIQQAAATEARMVRLADALKLHREWDKKMVIRAREAGIVDIDDPPELFL